MSYPFSKIEKKWQRIWAARKFPIWHAQEPSKKQKKYILDMFPYPSGEGLHVGHLRGYTASDILSRYFRMNNYNVLHPMGWDAFGLPAENYAIKTKTHPRLVINKNIRKFRKQLRMLGFSYDWKREINTTDPNYYKWTQWIFLQLFKADLAYEAEIPANWCPSCKTVLANEEVIGEEAKCERCGTKVERRKIKQWLLKITSYADKLLEDLKELTWPQKIKEMQKNWIGRSDGALIKFKSVNTKTPFIEAFTTRPDTLPGVTFIALAPEHPLVAETLSSDPSPLLNKRAVLEYVSAALKKSERQRLEKEKAGVLLMGIRAVNPLTGDKIPIYVADYILMHYGTGAIMGVPAHDERDFEFAQKYKLPIIEVIKTENTGNIKPPYIGNGTMMNAGEFNGLNNIDAAEKIMEKIGAQKTTKYKLRDWIFSRQRYWGEPIPIIKCPVHGNMPVPEDELPVKLPTVKYYEPTGKAESPLAGIKRWVETKCPVCHRKSQRETNTMPQWAGSNWYYLRYLDTKNKKAIAGQDLEKYWMPVDTYIGGAEHAVLHLLYARFWHKFLCGLGAVSTKEPFQKLINQGLILGPDGNKMSKSKGNVVNPEEVIRQFGADTLRMYEMFMGPLEDTMPWDPKSIIGVYRFLNRAYDFIKDIARLAKKNKLTPADNENNQRLLHRTIKKITEDIEQLKFNTAISALMILLNKLESDDSHTIESVKTFIRLLFPFAPHLTQECWKMLKQKGMLDFEQWPKWDQALIKDEKTTLIIQVNGRLRGKIDTEAGAPQKQIEESALKNENVKKFIGNQKIKKTIFIKDRLINFIV